MIIIRPAKRAKPDAHAISRRSASVLERRGVLVLIGDSRLGRFTGTVGRAGRSRLALGG